MVVKLDVILNYGLLFVYYLGGITSLFGEKIRRAWCYIGGMLLTVITIHLGCSSSRALIVDIFLFAIIMSVISVKRRKKKIDFRNAKRLYQCIVPVFLFLLFGLVFIVMSLSEFAMQTEKYYSRGLLLNVMSIVSLGIFALIVLYIRNSNTKLEKMLAAEREMKQQQMNYGITVKVRGMCYRKILANDTDVCTIFSNLLQNAVEALSHIDSGSLDIEISEGRHYVQMEIRNSIKPARIIIAGAREIKTSKRDKHNHGYGLQNVGEAIERNSGNFEFYVKDEMFCCEVILPVQE